MKKPLRILFVSRAYPPVLGGIENQNYGIAKALGAIAPTTIIANTKGKKFLPFFLPYAFVKMLFLLPRHDAVVFGDGVLAPLGRVAQWFFPRKTFTCIIHGLDVTYATKKSLMGKIYRICNLPALRAMDLLIAVGRQTIEEAVKYNISRDRCVFIPNGIDPEEYYRPTHTRADLDTLLNTDTTDKKVILRMGRFVPHKGLVWFIENVMPLLPENVILVAMGGAPAKNTAGDSNILHRAHDAAKSNGTADRVILLSNRPDSEKIVLFNTVDLVVSPNIHIPGSIEGFGINAIETAVCERVVLASDFQGLPDAIHDGENGFLLPRENAVAWRDTILRTLADDFDSVAFGKRARAYTMLYFSWSGIAQQYHDAIAAITQKHNC